MSDARSVIADGIAEVRPRVIAALAAQLRDLDLAEEAFAAASEKLLASDNRDIRDPAAWLFRAGMRKAIDAQRKAEREKRARASVMILSETETVVRLPDPIPDERLRLLFICCHPALAPEARVALALRVVCGVSVEEIARAFAVPVTTMYQRITRAKAKIRAANIPFGLPHRREWLDRVVSVLGALEVGYTLGYADASGEDVAEFAGETLRLADMLVELLPHDPEVKGFAAMLWLARSRHEARLDDAGAMVPLSQQDPALWDRSSIEKGRALLDEAAGADVPGPYQTLAAIHLAHAMRADSGETDWQSIEKLYDGLMAMRPGAIVAINHALALGQSQGAHRGLAAMDDIDTSGLANHRPLFVARARLLEIAGRREETIEELEKALATNPPKAERLFLESWQARLGEA